MSTKAEIEAEIARLTARLTHVEIDPAFTPSELVRWDPSLLGAVLRIRDQWSRPANTFNVTLSTESVSPPNSLWSSNYTPSLDHLYCASDSSRIVHTSRGGACREPKSKGVLENVGVLTPAGIQSPIEEYQESDTSGNQLPDKLHKYAVRNEFVTISQLPLLTALESKQDEHPTLPRTYGPGGIFDLRLNALGVAFKRCTANPHKMNLVVPLANPERFLLDQLYVSKMTKLRNTDVFIDMYPLSTLYQEWKRCKEAAIVTTDPGRMVNHLYRSGMHRTPYIPPRKTELDKANALIAELQGEVRALKAAKETEEKEYAKANDRLREALHIAVQTPNRVCSPCLNATSSDPAYRPE